MKTLHTKILAAYFAVATFTAFAGDTIGDAFGMRLGDVFDPASSIGASKATNGTVLYQFTRNKTAFPGFDGFDTCYVMLTPSSHKIYSILGVSSVTNKESGLAKQSIFMGMLRLKFSNKPELDKLVNAGDVQSIDQGSRHVISRVTEEAGGKIELEFLDSNLQKTADAEKPK
jgi:hypothetical protein